MRRMMRATLLAITGALAAGCATHHPGTGGNDDSTAVLSISPPTSELTILNGAPATEAFTATLTYPDGTTKDVTADTSYSIDAGYGLFTANSLAMTTAGKATALAVYGAKSASAEVIARLKDIRVDPSLPANTPDLFGGTEDPTQAPTVRYPDEGVIMPRNVGDFEVHWTDAYGHDVFELSLSTEWADVRAYVPGGNGDSAAGPEPTYASFLASEWLAAVGYETNVTYRVRGVSSANPGTVGAGVPREIKLSNEPMLGGLYYWAAASATGSPEGIYRHDMSMPGQPAQQYITRAQTGNRCVACHVLSRDGKEMAITYDGGNGQAALVDVATTTRQDLSNNWNFGTFSPDGTQFLSVYNGNLAVRRYSDQAVLAEMTSAGPVTHPDLSADGTKLVYVRANVHGSDWAFGSGDIYIRTYDQTSMTFGPETLLVTNGANNYYPSFSPDGAWVLFNKGDNSNNDSKNQHMSYNNPNASVWVVKADGSAPPVELAALNEQVGLTNSWARWAPFQQTLGANAQPMYWVTVSSKRDFGVRLVNLERPQIWMTPFFADRAVQGADPSAAAFRLPFQNIDSDNHIAQWTEQIVTTN